MRYGSLYFSGLPGVGKSVTALCVAQRLASITPSTSIIHIDFQHVDHDMRPVINSLLRALGVTAQYPSKEQPSALQNLYDQLTGAKQKLILLLDNVKTSDAATSLLPSTSTHNVLITSVGRPSRSSRLHHHVPLKPLEVHEATSLASKYFISMVEANPQSERDHGLLIESVERCGGLPAVLIDYARMIGEHSREGAITVDEDSDLMSDKFDFDSAASLYRIRAIVSSLPHRQRRLLAYASAISWSFSSGEVEALLGADSPGAVGRELNALARCSLVQRSSPNTWSLNRFLWTFLREDQLGVQAAEEANRAFERLHRFYRRELVAATSSLRRERWLDIAKYSTMQGIWNERLPHILEFVKYTKTSLPHLALPAALMVAELSNLLSLPAIFKDAVDVAASCTSSDQSVPLGICHALLALRAGDWVSGLETLNALDLTGQPRRFEAYVALLRGLLLLEGRSFEGASEALRVASELLREPLIERFTSFAKARAFLETGASSAASAAIRGAERSRSQDDALRGYSALARADLMLHTGVDGAAAYAFTAARTFATLGNTHEQYRAHLLGVSSLMEDGSWARSAIELANLSEIRTTNRFDEVRYQILRYEIERTTSTRISPRGVAMLKAGMGVFVEGSYYEEAAKCAQLLLRSAPQGAERVNLAEQALALSRKGSNVSLTADLLDDLRDALRKNYDPERVIALIKTKEAPEGHLSATEELMLAEAYRRGRQGDIASVHVSRALTLARDERDRRTEAACLLERGFQFLADGESFLAVRTFETGISLVDGEDVLLARLQYALAVCLAARGERSNAWKLLAKAVDGFRRFNYDDEAAEANERLSRLHS